MNVKETVCVNLWFQVTLYAKITSFSDLKCLILIISPWFRYASNVQVPNHKRNKQNKQKHVYPIHTWADKALKGTVVNWTLPYLHWRLFENSLVTNYLSFLSVTKNKISFWRSQLKMKIRILNLFVLKITSKEDFKSLLKIINIYLNFKD